MTTAGHTEVSNEVRLRNIEPNDLAILYEHQLDADATRLAAFPASDRPAFDRHWATKRRATSAN